jgi:hypothetical protein
LTLFFPASRPPRATMRPRTYRLELVNGTIHLGAVTARISNVFAQLALRHRHIAPGAGGHRPKQASSKLILNPMDDAR